jgi:Holliday junction resolvase RusA-like endonuclease
VLAPEARAYKVEVEKIVRALNEKPPEGLLQVHIRFYSTRWFNLNGTVKKRDASNLEKLCVDAIFAALEIDDSMIWKLTLEKVAADHERTEIELEKLEG